MMNRILEKNFGLFILGQSLIAISLGSIFSLEIVKKGFGFFIFIISTLLVSYYINISLLYGHSGKKIKESAKIMGFAGGFLLLFFFGIQSPQLPAKKIIFLIGFILILPGIKNLIYPVSYIKN